MTPSKPAVGCSVPAPPHTASHTRGSSTHNYWATAKRTDEPHHGIDALLPVEAQSNVSHLFRDHVCSLFQHRLISSFSWSVHTALPRTWTIYGQVNQYCETMKSEKSLVPWRTNHICCIAGFMDHDYSETTPLHKFHQLVFFFVQLEGCCFDRCIKAFSFCS